MVAALLVLQAKGRITAKELADELEVSERTARRDLEGLAQAGIPVYSLPGRGGGWTLYGGAKTDLSGLSADEATTLFLVAGPSAATPEVKAALRKLMAALPAPLRSGAQAAAVAMVRDPSAWNQAAVRPPDFLEEIQMALIEGVVIRLGYTDRDGAVSVRLVHPLGLVVKHQIWYLVAMTERGQRTFRLSRVDSVTRTSEPVQRPNDFDLSAAWRGIVDALEERRAPTRVALRTDARTAEAIGWVLGSRHSELEVAGAGRDDGSVEVVVRGQSPDMVARQLAGFADSIEVLWPSSVRRHLVDIGRALVAHHDRPASP